MCMWSCKYEYVILCMHLWRTENNTGYISLPLFTFIFETSPSLISTTTLGSSEGAVDPNLAFLVPSANIYPLSHLTRPITLSFKEMFLISIVRMGLKFINIKKHILTCLCLSCTPPHITVTKPRYSMILIFNST